MKKTCDSCGNDYDKTFTIILDGVSHVFDSFECAIHALAPRCGHCGCVIVGHGVESDGLFFCCAHCASRKGVEELIDRADTRSAGDGGLSHPPKTPRR